MSTAPIIESPGVEPRKVAIASASSPVNLGVLGGGVLGTLALVLAGHPMLGILVLALGVLAYGALIGLDMFNPRFIRRVYQRSAVDAALRADGAAAMPEIAPAVEPEVAPEISPDDLEPAADRHAGARDRDG